MTGKFPLEVRKAFERLDRETAHIATKAPQWAEVFTPHDHQGALDPDRSIVVGDRGTGKSFWSSVLINQGIRAIVAEQYPSIGLDRVDGRLGFSDAEMAAQHPGATEIASIMETGHSAEDIWRAVLLGLAPFPVEGLPPTNSGWRSVVDWVATDPARRNTDFRALDSMLTQAGKRYVLVFDALDVIAGNWPAIRKQLEGIIKLGLAVRALLSIRVKMFIRPDMADDRRLWEVGDASKLRHREVKLTWRRRDLYGLLWTLLANAQVDSDKRGGDLFRNHCAEAFGMSFIYQHESWRPPYPLVDDEKLQQEIFRALAGLYMGRSASKGDTYKWVPNHLSDAAGYAAPRSFLFAMNEGANATKSQETVLDKDGIQAGARKASEVRVAELSEDYRWMDTVLTAMEDLVVPITRENLTARWTERGTLASLRNMTSSEGEDRRFIPPGEVLEALDEYDAYKKLIEQLIRLKILLPLADGRINMPDLFRLQAKVKRKGGMKPRG